MTQYSTRIKEIPTGIVHSVAVWAEDEEAAAKHALFVASKLLHTTKLELLKGRKGIKRY